MELTVEILIRKHDLLEKMENMSGYSSRICLDEYWLEEHEKQFLYNNLEQQFEDFSFEIVPVFSGFAHDLLITNKKRKMEYDALPKTKKRGDIFKTLHEKYSTITTAMLGSDLNETITEEEYESEIRFYEFFMKQMADKGSD